MHIIAQRNYIERSVNSVRFDECSIKCHKWLVFCTQFIFYVIKIKGLPPYLTKMVYNRDLPSPS